MNKPEKLITLADLRIGDPVWQENSIGKPIKREICGLQPTKVSVDTGFQLKDLHPQSQKGEDRYKGVYYFNYSSALLAQYQALRKAAKEAQKKVAEALAEVDGLLEQKDKLVFKINDLAEDTIAWDEVNAKNNEKENT